MITYKHLTHDGFQQKLKIFGLTLKNKKDIEKYPFIRLKSDEIDYVDEICLWCQTNIGDNWIWSSATQTNRFYIYFINDADAFLCKLRFGEAAKEVLCEAA